jgi:hypothetical protein
LLKHWFAFPVRFHVLAIYNIRSSLSYLSSLKAKFQKLTIDRLSSTQSACVLHPALLPSPFESKKKLLFAFNPSYKNTAQKFKRETGIGNRF